MNYTSNEMAESFQIAIEAVELVEGQEQEKLFIKLFDLSDDSYMLRSLLMQSQLWIRYMEV